MHEKYDDDRRLPEIKATLLIYTRYRELIVKNPRGTERLRPEYEE